MEEREPEPQPLMPTIAPLGGPRFFFLSLSISRSQQPPPPPPCTRSVTRLCSSAAPQPGLPSAPLGSSIHPELGTRCAECGLRAKADIWTCACRRARPYITPRSAVHYSACTSPQPRGLSTLSLCRTDGRLTKGTSRGM